MISVLPFIFHADNDMASMTIFNYVAFINNIYYYHNTDHYPRKI